MMMNTKKKKPSELEKLQAKRNSLKAKLKVHEKSLDESYSYVQNNFSSLVKNTILDAVTGKFPFLGKLIPETTERSALESDKSTSVLSSVADDFINTLPVLYKGIKPIVFAFILKKIKNLFFK